MIHLLNIIVDGYNAIWELRDPRVDGWLLMSSPLPTLIICFVYVMTVALWGPAYMKNRPAFQFRNVLIVYNFLQVLLSAWIFYGVTKNGWAGHYNFQCQPIDYSDDPIAVAMTHVSWWYYFSKFTEFFDTFFFVLRKKNDQVSVLHVVHHGIMPMSVWFGVRFTPGGHATFFGMLNTFVHIIMYFYYMVAAMGPKYAKFIWWKKYLTVLQMVQFIGIFTHAFQLFFIECDFPIVFAWWIGGHGVLFLILFSNFFKKSYTNNKSRAVESNERRSSISVHQKIQQVEDEKKAV